jgi:NAD(P)H-nitrite reductase large subunit
VVGLTVTSVGEVNPEPGTREELRLSLPDQGIYKKIVLEDNRLTGAVWMGTKQGVKEISRLAGDKADVSKWKKELLDEKFDFSLLE